MQGFNPSHCHGMGPPPIAEATMGIVNIFRTVNTDPYNNLVAPKAIAPIIVDQCCIGLNMLVNL